jgi:hypothetical protein
MSMMKSWLLVSVGSLLLYGCAEVKYAKHGATEADFEADRVDCRSQILMAPPVPTIASGQMGKPGVREGITTQSADQSAQREVDQCLRAKGWIPESQSR